MHKESVTNRHNTSDKKYVLQTLWNELLSERLARQRAEHEQ